MKSKLCHTGKVVAVLAILGLVASCGPGYIEAGYGRVYLQLNADGAKCSDYRGCSGIADSVLEAWAEIDEVSVHMARGGGWVVISDTPVKVDLLRLADHAADLGFGQIPSGKVTQIRLHVVEGSESYVVEDGGSVVPMSIPSGIKSGIKIVGKFNVGPCTENVVGLTISDHHSAIHVHPDGQLTRYIFRPVIKLGEVITEEGECDDPGNGGGGDDGDGDGDGDGGGGDGQECIPGDDAFPCPGGSTGNDGSGDDGTGDDGTGDDGTGDGTGDDGTGDGTGDDGTGDGTGDDGTGDGTGDDGTGDGTGDDGTGDGTGDDGSGDGTGDGTCDPAVDDTCRP